MTNEPPRPDSDAIERVRRPIVYRVPEMDAVRVHSNLKYANTCEPRMLMDVYVPPTEVVHAKRAAVVMIHGGVPGPFPVKDMGTFRSWGRLIASQGMVGVAFTHRMLWPLAQLDESAKDVQSAIDYVRANAYLFGVDADRICIMAWSAGGLLLPAVLKDQPEYVRCVVGLYPLLNENWTADPNTPTLIARAGQDAIPRLNEILDRFAERAAAAGSPVTILNHPAGVHGFDVETDDERTREIIQTTLGFIGARTR